MGEEAGGSAAELRRQRAPRDALAAAAARRYLSGPGASPRCHCKAPAPAAAPFSGARRSTPGGLPERRPPVPPLFRSHLPAARPPALLPSTRSSLHSPGAAAQFGVANCSLNPKPGLGPGWTKTPAGMTGSAAPEADLGPMADVGLILAGSSAPSREWGLRRRPFSLPSVPVVNVSPQGQQRNPQLHRPSSGPAVPPHLPGRWRPSLAISVRAAGKGRLEAEI